VAIATRLGALLPKSSRSESRLPDPSQPLPGTCKDRRSSQLAGATREPIFAPTASASGTPRHRDGMDDLDKVALGERVRRIRIEAGLRQWELARRLGTTQSAVHKYEHGVVPEPRRLIELARIGATSVEWILTGKHW